jgi:peptidoglycan hydrolase-like protein with peptidoglycan-binding domain
VRRRALLAGGTAIAAAAAGTGWWLQERPAATPAAAELPTGTATVTRIDLASTTQVQGSLGFRDAYTVLAQGRGGTVTWLPQPGQVIQRGQPVFEVDNRPVRLFYGTRPAWRPLGPGVTNGPDVRALEENLNALGFHLAADNHFGTTTAAAVRRWQRATGQTVNGTVDLGDVTFQPGPMRVTETQVGLAGSIGGGGPVLTASSTVPVVTIQVPATQTYLVHPGDAVTVTMPDGSKAPGKVKSLSPVAENDPAEQGNGRQTPTATGTVTLNTAVTGTGLDKAPVAVAITSGRAENVLAVPITALVALAGGGYGVYVVEGANRRLVGVTPGLFADTLVQVSGDALHEGDTVEVPQP